MRSTLASVFADTELASADAVCDKTERQASAVSDKRNDFINGSPK
jgi:hypothetical protein